jgi:TetR/AcrR family transcriptional regulator, regulator of cefoperazone and chloramphenicol sensitivity
MPTATAPGVDTTKERLLEVAGQVFAEHGFEHATVREICRRANANIASVNYHFGGKEELYAEVLAHGAQVTVDAFPPDLGLGPTPTRDERLYAFIHSLLLRVLKKDRPTSWYTTLCTHEMVAPTKALDRVVDQVIRPMAGRLGEIVQDYLPRASAETVNRFAMSIVGQCLFYHHCSPVIDRLNGPQRHTDTDIKRLAEHITAFSLAALRGHRATKERARR